MSMAYAVGSVQSTMWSWVWTRLDNCLGWRAAIDLLNAHYASEWYTICGQRMTPETFLGCRIHMWLYVHTCFRCASVRVGLLMVPRIGLKQLVWFWFGTAGQQCIEKSESCCLSFCLCFVQLISVTSCKVDVAQVGELGSQMSQEALPLGLCMFESRTDHKGECESCIHAALTLICVCVINLPGLFAGIRHCWLLGHDVI